ncbi:unnamed protein product [Nezara viridula]|uniref:Neuropeptide n=1 Tax=Nezara viridula TaxID=85310 RepID=A0A9P0E851_NEZVI|nr:unnamed protein product [Nezara viridula]
MKTMICVIFGALVCLAMFTDVSSLPAYTLNDKMLDKLLKEIERMAGDLDYQWDSDDIETSWFYSKKIIRDAAALVCGIKRIGGRYKRTAW